MAYLKTFILQEQKTGSLKFNVKMPEVSTPDTSPITDEERAIYFKVRVVVEGSDANVRNWDALRELAKSLSQHSGRVQSVLFGHMCDCPKIMMTMHRFIGVKCIQESNNDNEAFSKALEAEWQVYKTKIQELQAEFFPGMELAK